MLTLARFTDSIASTEGWSYGAGAEVLVAGDQYEKEAVPETIGAKWLASGLLVPVESSVEAATSRAPETSVHHPRRGAAPRR